MSATPGSTLREGTPPAAARVVEEAEHFASVLRLRKVLGVGMLMWTIWVVGDITTAHAVAPHVLGTLVAIRVGGGLVFASAWLRLRLHPRITPLEYRVHIVGCFTLASALLSTQGVIASGVPSAYFGGLMVVLVLYAVAIGEHWRRAALSAAGIMLPYPASVLIGALVSPAVAAQLHDPVLRALFTGNVMNLITAYVGVVVAGHMGWALRRQVFETRSLGRYKLKRRIGAGGMGEVWQAHHATLKRDVAVKILRRDRFDTSSITRFEREVRATTELAHPNTVRVFDYGVTDDGVSFYAMELLDGESLGALVAREGALPPARAIHLVGQAARALAEAHAKGIVHRDVKPENIFVATIAGQSDFVKVLDFGIAKVIAGERDSKLTDTGSLMGTPAWLAPEAILGTPIDARADVYALGAVLYFALAGRPPFESSNGAYVVSAHLHDLPAPPSAKRGGPIGIDVETVVMRCLEKSPDARYPTAAELAEALAACVVDAHASERGPRREGVAVQPEAFADTLIDPASSKK